VKIIIYIKLYSPTAQVVKTTTTIIIIIINVTSPN